MHFTRICLSLACCLWLSGQARAAIIWNESVNGDLSNVIPATNLGTLAFAANTIIGGLDGGTGPTSGPDEEDLIFFTATSTWTIDINSISGVAVVHFLFTSPNPSGPISFLTANSASGPSTNLIGSQPAGSYVMGLVPAGNSGQSAYQFTINTTPAAAPEPATLTMFGLGILGFAGAALRRRKRAA